VVLFALEHRRDPDALMSWRGKEGVAPYRRLAI
jgi:hypothetical protein